jgi:hypothetical protein
VRHAPHAGACQGRHRAEIDPPRQKCKAGHQAQVFRAQPIGTTAQEPSRRASRQLLQPRLPGAGSRPPGPRPPCHVIGAPDITSDDLDAAALQAPGHNRGGYGSHIEAPTVAPGAFRALTNASTGSLLVIRTRLLDVVWSLRASATTPGPWPPTARRPRAPGCTRSTWAAFSVLRVHARLRRVSPWERPERTMNAVQFGGSNRDQKTAKRRLANYGGGTQPEHRMDYPRATSKSRALVNPRPPAVRLVLSDGSERISSPWAKWSCPCSRPTVARSKSSSRNSS